MLALLYIDSIIQWSHGTMLLVLLMHPVLLSIKEHGPFGSVLRPVLAGYLTAKEANHAPVGR